MIEVACWAHARRYFYKALDSDPDRAKVALSHIRSWPQDRLLELAPAYWQKTLEQSETQHKLAANVFRRAVLSPPA